MFEPPKRRPFQPSAVLRIGESTDRMMDERHEVQSSCALAQYCATIWSSLLGHKQAPTSQSHFQEVPDLRRDDLHLPWAESEFVIDPHHVAFDVPTPDANLL